MKTHKELIPNNVGTFEERNVTDGYHYELQLLNGVWQWVLIADNKELIISEGWISQRSLV